MYEKLDNPVYHSLNEYHEKFCFNFGETKFYNPEVASFGGAAELSREKTSQTMQRSVMIF